MIKVIHVDIGSPNICLINPFIDLCSDPTGNFNLEIELFHMPHFTILIWEIKQDKEKIDINATLNFYLASAELSVMQGPWH